MAYTYNRTITIDHTLCGSASSSDFPALIHLNDATFKTVGNGGHVQNASAFDVGFFSDSLGTTPLFWEVLSYDGSTGELWAFVKIPTLSHTTDTVIYVFYDDAAISTFQSTASSVWSANYVRVMHLSESAHPYLDSTSNAYSSTSTVDPTQVAGEFNLAQSFVGASSQKITGMTQPTNVGGQGTYSGWFKSSTTNNISTVIDGRGNASQIGGVLYVNNNVPSFYTNNVGPIAGSSGICDGAWHYLVATYQGSASMELYVDGASVASIGNCGAYQNGNVTVGVTTDASPVYATAVLQEVRQSTVKQSTSWITSDYNNQSSPDTFITVGAEAGGILFGYFDATADPLLAFTTPFSFTGTAEPTATFSATLYQGYFAATADPRLSVTPGYILFTADPLCTYSPITNAYTEMGFTAPAYPHLDWVGLENQAVNTVFTAHPQLTIFVPVGQSGRCASGEGVGHRDSSTPTNYVF